MSRDVGNRDYRQYLHRVRRQRETESCTCKIDALPGHHDFVSGEPALWNSRSERVGGSPQPEAMQIARVERGKGEPGMGACVLETGDKY